MAVGTPVRIFHEGVIYGKITGVRYGLEKKGDLGVTIEPYSGRPAVGKKKGTVISMGGGKRPEFGGNLKEMSSEKSPEKQSQKKKKRKGANMALAKKQHRPAQKNYRMKGGSSRGGKAAVQLSGERPE